LSLRVVLIEIRDLGPVFLAEPELAGPLDGSAKGIMGWLARKRVAIHKDLVHAEGFLGRTLRRAWNRLQRLVEHDEHILRGLRTAGHLDLDHPRRIASDDALALWDGYLWRRLKRHRAWLIADGLAAPLALLLTPVPGPNLVSYWLWYRLVIHYLAMRGAMRAKAGKIPTVAVGRDELDAVIASGDDEPVARMSACLNFPDLATALEKIVPPRPE
jgi:hypothetical protein